MGCGCGGAAKRRAAKMSETKTDGRYRIDFEDGDVQYHDSKISADAWLIRAGKPGVVVRNV